MHRTYKGDQGLGAGREGQREGEKEVGEGKGGTDIRLVYYI